MSAKLEGRVAIVTGAGSGLGREHALLLAKYGAHVVVNDPGGAVNGDGSNAAVADNVVDIIRAAGGKAVASYDSVATPEGAEKIVRRAIDEFGKLDILVNNAGILRDKSFLKMDMKDFESVIQVHLLGSAFCTKAAWPYFAEQKYGRVVMTTSSAGTNGNFGQSNYGAAKMGLLGLMHCLAIEGRKNDILVNAVSPGANTRMTEGLGLMDTGFQQHMKAELVSPAVAWLASDKCDVTGVTITAAAGGYGRIHMFESLGVQFDPNSVVGFDDFVAASPRILDLVGAEPAALAPQGRMEERLDASQWSSKAQASRI